MQGRRVATPCSMPCAYTPPQARMSSDCNNRRYTAEAMSRTDGRGARRTLRYAPALALALGLCVGASAKCAASPSWVSAYPRVREAAAKACQQPAADGCRRDLLQLMHLLDGRIDVVYRLAQAEAARGLRAASLAHLELYARSGLDLGDPQLDSVFAPLRDSPRFAALERQYRAGLVPVGTHQQLADMPAADLIAEDLAIDPRDGTRYVSSVHGGTVLKLDVAGNWSVAFKAVDLSAWGIYALALDARRDRLWAGSVAGAVSPPYQPTDAGRSAILRLDLRGHALQRRYQLQDQQPHAFGDMALGESGEVYVSDGVGGGVYRIGPGDESSLETLLPPGFMRSPQTPVPLPGGKRLLVPDYSRGIAVLDPRRPGAISWLAHPPELALYGIDGMYLHGRTLVAIQNGTDPERLLLLQLDAALTRVTGWKVALARAVGLGDPTHGVVRGDRFEFISNSGWDRVADDGSLSAGVGATAPAIWSVALPAQH